MGDSEILATTASLNRLTFNDAGEVRIVVQRSDRQKDGRQFFMGPTVLHDRRGRYQRWTQCSRQSELHLLWQFEVANTASQSIEATD